MPIHLPDERLPNERLPNEHLPKKPRAKVAAVQDPQQQSEAHKRRVKHPIETIDWLALWALSIGLSALVLAGVVLFNDNDTVGASAIFAGAAGIIALVLLFSEAPGEASSERD